MDNSVTTRGNEYAGVLLLLLRRYAANLPDGRRNDVDRTLSAALDRIPESRAAIAGMVAKADALPQDRKRALFGGTHAFQPVATAVSAPELEQVIGRLGGRKTPPATSRPSAHKYDLRFSHMICDDESNPESFGKDEPYEIISMITQAQMEAGTPARSVRTPVYKTNEGDRAPASGSEDLRLWGVGAPAVIDSDLLVTVVHVEHDMGNISKIVTDITAVVTAAAVAAKAAKQDLIAVALGIVASLGGLVTALAADDPVGEPQQLLLSQADADAFTKDAAQVTLPALRFNGGDSNGVYRSFLTLRRT
ncbi:hypothetical protein F8568_015780 [Actinomadura sp. LD22]|uniref:Uncharacterized protein n=1 Tax=Actinomadura physcomitrii TaxID=2650748 RepID=A0A6I4MC27_9ACTN|nr:hypothetical protein [Actinomadura physcomitrii]MWA01804.1 hypothetical protein [Actinomadura physcomitrii]